MRGRSQPAICSSLGVSGIRIRPLLERAEPLHSLSGAQGRRRLSERGAGGQRELGIELQQRRQHEAATCDLRVRQHQPAALHHAIAEDQNVDVDRPRSVSRSALTAQRQLHPLTGIEQILRIELGLDFQDRVVEVPLVRYLPYRLRLVDRRSPQDADARCGAEKLDRRPQIGQPVADVGAESQVCDCESALAPAGAQRDTSTDISSTATGKGGSGLVARTVTPLAPKRSTSMSAIAVQSRSRVRYERSVAR
jgi:hypothetical protein